MLTRLFDFQDPFTLFDAFERRWHPAFDETSSRQLGIGRISLKDNGEALSLTAVLPGVAREDLDMSIEGTVLTLKAQRKLDAPKGYRLIRRERGEISFTKRIDLGVLIDGSAVLADLEDGILTVTLPKAPEAKPRKIAIGKSTPVGQA